MKTKNVLWIIPDLFRLVAIFALLLALQSCITDEQRLLDRPTVQSFQEVSETDSEGEPIEESDLGVTRPSGEVFIQSNYCSCLEGQPDSLNNCSSFCSTKDDEIPTLYVSTTLGPEIALNESLGSLQNWCKQEIADGLTAPNCQLEAYDGNDFQFLDIDLSGGGNSFTANVTVLDFNKPYVLTLVENGSGSDARSKSFQFQRFSFLDNDNVQGALGVAPISRYTCISRSGATDSSTPPNDFFIQAVKRHFYFYEGNAPTPLARGNDFLHCHDINVYGDNDSPTIPRMELEEQIFTLWNETDQRFFDQDDNSKIDINDIIQDELLNNFNITSDINIFAELTWPNSPEGDDTPPRLGFIMQPWVDPDDNLAYCPGHDDYNNSGIPVFSVLKQLVGVETEGLYMAIREPQSFENTDGTVTAAPDDFVLMREGVLEKVWFYLDDNLHVKPNASNVNNHTIMFYWPPDIYNPYVKGNRLIYTVRHPSQLGQEARSGLRNNIIPSDRRFACIPKLNND